MPCPDGDATHQKHNRVVEANTKEADLMQELLQRVIQHRSFKPFTLLWYRAVWESLDRHYLKPKAIIFADSITRAPNKSRKDGEALLAYRAIPLLPCQTLFKAYHYAWQYNRGRWDGVDPMDQARFVAISKKQIWNARWSGLQKKAIGHLGQDEKYAGNSVKYDVSIA